MTEVDPSQQTQNEVKTEGENAPINVKVCPPLQKLTSMFLYCVDLDTNADDVPFSLFPSRFSHTYARACAGRQLDRRRSLFQNQAKYEIEQVARGLCGQGGQGRVEHSVRVSFPFPFPLLFVIIICVVVFNSRDARSCSCSYARSSL